MTAAATWLGAKAARSSGHDSPEPFVCSAWLDPRLFRAALAHGAGWWVCAGQHDARSNSRR